MLRTGDPSGPPRGLAGSRAGSQMVRLLRMLPSTKDAAVAKPPSSPINGSSEPVLGKVVGSGSLLATMTGSGAGVDERSVG